MNMLQSRDSGVLTGIGKRPRKRCGGGRQFLWWRMTVLLMVAGLWGAAVKGAGQEGTLPTVTRQEAALLDRVDAVAATNSAAAIALLRSAMDDRAPGAALSYTLGSLLARDEAHTEAVKAYRQALDAWPGFTEARIGKARTLALAEAWERAETVARPLALEGRASEQVLLLYGAILLNLDRLVSAESIYRRAALAGGDRTDALHGLAQCFMRQNRYPETEALAAELVRRRPDEPSYWTLWADAWMAMDRPREAGVRLEAARRRGIATLSMLVRLGDLFLDQGLADDAREVYLVAFQRSDLSMEILLRMAEGLTLAGDVQTARNVLDRLRPEVHAAGDRIAPSLRIAYLRTEARWAELTGDPPTVRDAHREWVRWDPLNATAMLLLGDAYRATDDSVSARLWYERAARADTELPYPLLRLAQMALDDRDYGAALDILEQAYQRGGDPGLQRSIRQIQGLQTIAE